MQAYRNACVQDACSMHANCYESVANSHQACLLHSLVLFWHTLCMHVAPKGLFYGIYQWHMGHHLCMAMAYMPNDRNMELQLIRLHANVCHSVWTSFYLHVKHSMWTYYTVGYFSYMPMDVNACVPTGHVFDRPVA